MKDASDTRDALYDAVVLAEADWREAEAVASAAIMKRIQAGVALEKARAAFREHQQAAVRERMAARFAERAA